MSIDKINKILQNKIKDKRFYIPNEYCGYAEIRYVLRFNGDWIMQSANYSDCCDAAERFKL